MRLLIGMYLAIHAIKKQKQGLQQCQQKGRIVCHWPASFLTDLQINAVLFCDFVAVSKF